MKTHISPQKLPTVNEYLEVDQETFRKRVSENRDKIRNKLKELNMAKKVYIDLLNFNIRL